VTNGLAEFVKNQTVSFEFSYIARWSTRFRLLCFVLANLSG